MQQQKQASKYLKTKINISKRTFAIFTVFEFECFLAKCFSLQWDMCSAVSSPQYHLGAHRTARLRLSRKGAILKIGTDQEIDGNKQQFYGYGEE